MKICCQSEYIVEQPRPQWLGVEVDLFKTKYKTVDKENVSKEQVRAKEEIDYFLMKGALWCECRKDRWQAEGKSRKKYGGEENYSNQKLIFLMNG